MGLEIVAIGSSKNKAVDCHIKSSAIAAHTFGTYPQLAVASALITTQKPHLLRLTKILYPEQYLSATH